MFPSRVRTLAPGALSPKLYSSVFGVCNGLVSRHDPLAITVLYPRRCITRHYLNSFRGEPAISKFVWPFTPTHSSSTHFCNSGSFGPPAGVTQPSAWPWVDHLVSGLRPATKAPISDSLSLRFPYAVKLATERKSLTHYTKGTPSPSINGSIDPPVLALPSFRKLTERVF